MLDTLLIFAVGLVVGWNFLPQPTWVKSLVTYAVDKVKGWFNG